MNRIFFKISKILFIILIFSNTLVFAGTRFTLIRREIPDCPYNPYSAGVIAVISGGKEDSLYYN